MALRIMLWGGAQWLGRGRKTLPPTPTPQLTRVSVPICKMRRQIQRWLESRNTISGPHPLCVCVNTINTSSSAPHGAWPRSRAFYTEETGSQSGDRT